MTFTEIYPISQGSHNSSRRGINLLNEGVVLSSKQKKMLDLASKMAESSMAVTKHGAVIVSGGRVMALGVNKWRNAGIPPTPGYNPHLTIHAEADAISRVTNARGSTVYIARINSKGESMYSRPCEVCQKMMNDAGVKRVVYTVR